MTDLQRAKSCLTGETTCVLCKGESLYISEKTGIAPVADWLAEGKNLTGYSAADRIVGRAAAMLFILAGVKEVYSEVMSRGAVSELERAGVACSWGTLTDRIRNRAGDGPCPMDRAVEGLTNPEACYAAIQKTRAQLRAAQNIA